MPAYFMFPWTEVSRGFFVQGVVLLHGNIQIHGKKDGFVYLFVLNRRIRPPPEISLGKKIKFSIDVLKYL